MSIIKGRLRAVADMVTPGLVVADVGCDHAYLSIYLVTESISPKVIACDVNEGPLEIARTNINDFKCEDNIELRLGNGLDVIKPQEVSSVVIAGMGGRLITDIIKAGKEVLDSACEIIIEPQSELEMVRHFLEDNGYKIVSENLIIDEGKFYPIIKAIHGEMNLCDEVYYRYGKIPIEENNSVLREYLLRQRKHLSELTMHIGSNASESEKSKRLNELHCELKVCERALALISKQEVCN